MPGALVDGGGANNDWAIPFSAASFVVDPSGSGTLVITPTNNVDAAYAGTGSSFTSADAVTVTAQFTLSFLDGQSAKAAGANLFEMGVKDAATGNAYNIFIFRWAGNDGVNLQIRTQIDSTDGQLNQFGGNFLLSEIGLTMDDPSAEAPVFAGDQTSDMLQLAGSIVKSGSEYLATLTITNLTTGTLLGTATSTFSGASYDAFMSGEKTAHLSAAQFFSAPVAASKINVDSFSVSTDIPEQPATWAGFEIDEDGWIDTGEWLGALWVTNDPWIWIHDTGSYVYLPEANVSESGGWLYLPGN